MSTKLPAAVQRQLAETAELDAKIAAEQAPNPAPEPTPPEPEPAPEPPAAPPPAAPPTEENWQHKFLTLQGKYNTETAELRDQVKTLQDEVQALKAARPSTPEPAAPAAPEPAKKLVTDADVEAFGADLVDLIRRAAREVSEPEKAKLLAEIEVLKGRLPTLERDVETMTTTVVGDRREKYFVELAKLVPDYAAINVDEAFIGWLTERDPLSGLERNAILQSAFKDFDHSRTAVIFNAFKQETGRTAPTPPTTPPVVETPQGGLEAQVSPGTSRTATVITPDDGKKVWTASEVNDFYIAVTRGDYRGSQDEARRIDAEIDKALIEGRVRA